MSDEKIKQVILPYVAITCRPHSATEIDIVHDGATSHVTVTLDDGENRYFRVEQVINVTPTDKDWR